MNTYIFKKLVLFGLLIAFGCNALEPKYEIRENISNSIVGTWFTNDNHFSYTFTDSGFLLLRDLRVSPPEMPGFSIKYDVDDEWIFLELLQSDSTKIWNPNLIEKISYKYFLANNSQSLMIMEIMSHTNGWSIKDRVITDDFSLVRSK